MKDITVLEVSYEVANKIGGINTVLKTKTRSMKSNLREYMAIGPYYQDKAATDFRESAPPEKLKRVFDAVQKNHGIACHFGKWVAEGEPDCILVDFRRDKINEIKAKMWETYKIDSLKQDPWYDEPIAWSWAVGLLVHEMVNSRYTRRPVVVHCHEWLSGGTLLYLHMHKVKVGTVFTTHATVMGRAIAGTGREDLYDMIEAGIRQKRSLPTEKAYEYNSQSKHMVEAASAQQVGVFTAVSESISRECAFMLGRKPDMVLPNGLNMDKFPKLREIGKNHEKNASGVREFLRNYFSPYYELDLANTTTMFISGRFEFRNKGVDVFIDALSMLNNRMKSRGDPRRVVAFFFIPADARRGNPKKGDRPPISPFVFPSKNEITSAFERTGLLNNRDDPVKVIFYPTYLSEKDGLLNMNYYDVVSGFDLGVFPSYYEPWGYTPVEAAAMGVQSVTTDLAGLGKFIKRYLRKDDYSMVVLRRDNRKYESVVRELESVLNKIVHMSAKKTEENRIRAKKLSEFSDWKRLIRYYLRAYEKALKKVS